MSQEWVVQIISKIRNCEPLDNSWPGGGDDGAYKGCVDDDHLQSDDMTNM